MPDTKIDRGDPFMDVEISHSHGYFKELRPTRIVRQ
jgi:hypothetical protein